jgi:proteic killer suppression protein
MQITFNNDYLEAIYRGEPVKGKPQYPQVVIEKFIKRIELIKVLDRSGELWLFKSLNFEKLKGDKKDLYSIRVDKQYRLEFRIINEVIQLTELVIIEDLSKHYQ